MSNHASIQERGVREPLIGFVLAVVLTAIPFAFVAARTFSFVWTLLIVGVCAVVQVVVHLRYFLHVDFSPASRDRLVALAFSAVILFLMAGGTIWIVLDLHARMLF